MEQDQVLPAPSGWQKFKLSIAMKLLAGTDHVIADRPSLEAALAWCHDTLRYVDASGGLSTPVPQRIRAHKRIKHGLSSARGWLTTALRDPRFPFRNFLAMPSGHQYRSQQAKESAA
jgi:hypothetical protein